MLIETAIPKFSIEALDKGIQCRLSRLNESQRDLPLTRPEVHRLAGQLGGVIADNRGWQRALLRDLVQEPGQATPENGRVHQLANTLY